MRDSPVINCFFDHQNFYLNDQPFYPKISSNFDNTDCNTVIITLDCSNKSILEFNDSIKQAELAIGQNKYVIWDVHLGLENQNFLIRDDLYLKSILHSLSCFIDSVYTPFKDSSIGIILYSGEIPDYKSERLEFENLFDSSLSKNKNGFGKTYLKQIYNCDLLAYYLRLIAPNIPDEISMVIRLDVTNIESQSCLINLLSQERFEYFLLALRGSKTLIPAIMWEHGKGNLGQIDCEHYYHQKEASKVGVCFPSSDNATQAEFDQFDKIFQELSTMKIDFRVLEETLATEQWDGLDYIIVRKNSLSLHGIRMLQGFCAASGTTVYHDLPVGISNEISFETFKLS